ncbi:P27 family phage terminase small subunit [Weissella viridescens]
MAKSKIEKSLYDGIEKVREVTEYDQEMISRYVKFKQNLDEFDKDIAENGVMITVINSTQEYRKVNPAVTEKEKINTAMNAIFRTLGLDAKSLAEQGNNSSQGGGLL